MDELDKLFKDKLHDRTFEFKDAYWEDAERLIDLDEADRKRRGGLWWRFGALLLVFAIAGYYLFGYNTTASSIHSTSNVSSDEGQSTANPIIHTEEQAISTVQNGFSNPQNISQENTNNNNLKNINSSSEKASQNEESRFPDTEVSSYEKNTPINEATKKGANNSFHQDALKEIKALDVEELNIQLPPPDSANTKRKEIAIDDLKPIIIDQELETIQEAQSDLGELALLETVVSKLELPKEDCDGCFDFDMIKQKRLAFGVVAEGIAYRVKEGETNWRGGSVGLTAKYKLNRGLSLNTGVQYSMIQGNGGRVLDPTSPGGFAPNLQRAEYDFFDENQYSFGLRNVEAIFPPKNFHSLDIPLTLQLSKKHSSFEFGFQWNLLLGVRGSQITSYSLFPWEQESLGASSSFGINEVKSKEWLPKDNYRKILTRVTLGYRYAFNPRFSVGINAYYRTQKLNNRYASTASTSAESTAGNSFTPKRLHIRLGATYFIDN